MNFTREPIIETVITPREGCKLVVRSSKGDGEEYYVDALEVVSFGRSIFYRSLERPKAFLLPVGDYEVLELREVRVGLKNAPSERSIKIGGGREGGSRPSGKEGDGQSAGHEGRSDRKRDRRRRSRRGGNKEREAPPMQEDAALEEVSLEEPLIEPSAEVTESVEGAKAPSFISKLFPPPPTLIKESLGRYKVSEGGEEVPPIVSSLEEEEETLFHHEDVPSEPDVLSDEEEERGPEEE